MTGWRMEGMISFTRQALWKKVEEDEVIFASRFTSAGSLPSSTPSPTLIAALDSNTTLCTPGGLPTTPPTDPSTLPPLRIQRISEAVLIVGDYLQSCAPAASGILDVEAIVMQNLRFLEAAKVFREWKRTINTEKDNENNMTKRISSSDIYGHAGSATEDITLAMLKTEEDKREAFVALVAAKKDTTKDKRAKDTTALVTTGSEILKSLEQLDLSELMRLKIDELYALLVNGDPLGSIPMPNKKEGQEKANNHCASRSRSLFSGSNSLSSVAASDSRGSYDLRGTKYK